MFFLACPLIYWSVHSCWFLQSSIHATVCILFCFFLLRYLKFLVCFQVFFKFEKVSSVIIRLWRLTLKKRNGEKIARRARWSRWNCWRRIREMLRNNTEWAISENKKRLDIDGKNVGLQEKWNERENTCHGRSQSKGMTTEPLQAPASAINPVTKQALSTFKKAPFSIWRSFINSSTGSTNMWQKGPNVVTARRIAKTSVSGSDLLKRTRRWLIAWLTADPATFFL